MTDEVKQPAVVVRLQRPVRPADGVVLDAEGWPVLTQRGSEDAQIKYRGGQRVYSQDALDAAVAAERERWPDRYVLGDAILRAWKKHGQDSWCSIADDVLRECGPNEPHNLADNGAEVKR